MKKSEKALYICTHKRFGSSTLVDKLDCIVHTTMAKKASSQHSLSKIHVTQKKFLFMTYSRYISSFSLQRSYVIKIAALTGKALNKHGPKPTKNPFTPLCAYISQKCSVIDILGRFRATLASILDPTKSKG